MPIKAYTGVSRHIQNLGIFSHIQALLYIQNSSVFRHIWNLRPIYPDLGMSKLCQTSEMNWFAKIINGYTNLTKFWMRLRIGRCSFCMTFCSWVTVLCSFKWLVQGDHCVKSARIWSALSRISRKLRISPYLVQMRENADQKNSEYGHFSHRRFLCKITNGMALNDFEI